MKSLIQIIKVESKLFLRDFYSSFFTLLFPFILLIIFGIVYGDQKLSMFEELKMIDILVPAYMGMIIASTGIMSLPLQLTYYREFKILKRLKATPINPLFMLISQVVVHLIMTVLGILGIVISGKIFFGVVFSGNLFNVCSSILISTFSIFSLGFVISSISKNRNICNVLSYIIFYSNLFLAGIMIPTEYLPNIFKNISYVLPLTYVVDLLKGVWMGGNDMSYLFSLSLLLLMTILGIGISVRFFRWE